MLARPYGQEKTHDAFRFTADLKRRLKKAARKAGMTKTAYIEAALEEQFKKDGIE